VLACLRVNSMRRVVIAVVTAALLVACGPNTGRMAGRVLAGVDDAAHVANIWGGTASQDARLVQSAVNATNRAKSQGGISVLTTATRAATIGDEVLASLQAADGGVFSLVGHTSNNRIHFADGSFIDLIGIADKTRARVALLGCETESFVRGTGAGLPTALTLDVALATEAGLASRVAAFEGTPTADELQVALLEAFEEAAHAQNVANVVKVSAAFALPGTAVIIVYQVGT
jgi:hypothetical protein